MQLPKETPLTMGNQSKVPVKQFVAIQFLDLSLQIASVGAQSLRWCT